MDFKKIAQIFIVAFLFLNLYLIYGILERKDIQQTSTQADSYNIIANMEEMGIDLPDLTELNSEEQEVHSIQADPQDTYEMMANQLEDNDNHTGSLDEDGVYYLSFPSNPIQLSGNPTDGFTKEDYQLIKDYIVSEELIFGEEYSQLEYDHVGKRFVLYQDIDGLPIIDGSSEISLFVNQSGEIYAFEQTYAGPVSRQGNPLDLIDGKRAIELLFINNKIRENVEVLEPVLAYHRALYLEDLAMYSPVWSIDIMYDGEKDNFRVDAVSGTIIKKQTTNKPDNSEGNNESKEDGSEDN